MTTSSLQGKKIISAKEMARIEALAISSSNKMAEEFMNRAGEEIAKLVEKYAAAFHLSKNISVLIGKGNKGGDAIQAALQLMLRGFSVKAICLYDLDNCSELCRLQAKRFQGQGGDLHFLETAFDLSFQGSALILDGIFGTGFDGALQGLPLQAIEKANASCLPIIAIDIPSGLNGSTGEVVTSAIKASLTIYLGLPKIGFFILKGYNHIGELVGVDFGLAEEFQNRAEALAYLVDERALFTSLPPIVRNRHKYQRGFIVGVAGSKKMAGAAKLAALSALRAGSGIIRLFHSHDASSEMSDTPMEVIKEKWSLHDMPKFLELIAKANAFFIGPGMGRDKEAEDFFVVLLPKLQKPVVIDADALFILAKHPNLSLPNETILTPHRQEMLRLLGEDAITHEWEFLEKCQAFTNQRKITLVLKGAPTFVFTPNLAPFIIPRGDPGMATAGSGDVLTGILAALLAQKLDTYHAALLGVYLHAYAGELAAKDLTSYAMIASDLITYLPKAYKKILTLRNK